MKIFFQGSLNSLYGTYKVLHVHVYIHVCTCTLYMNYFSLKLFFQFVDMYIYYNCKYILFKEYFNYYLLYFSTCMIP